MKKVLAIIAGVVAGLAIAFIGNATKNALSPTPAGLNTSNRDEMREYILSLPMYVLIIVMIFWLGSSFLGGMLASRLNRVNWKSNALITGSILFAATLLNLIMAPHPAWIWITVVLGYIPAALLGGWLVRKKAIAPSIAK